MSHLALDLSKAGTGFANWAAGMDLPVLGHWELGSALTSPGRVFLRLQKNLNELHQVSRLVSVSYETPLYLDVWQPEANKEAHFLLVGLAAHVESFCDAKGIRIVRSVHAKTWRRKFLGPMKRGTRRHTLKQLTIERCRQLGMRPRNDDEADAAGIMDYALDLEGVAAPWRDARLFGGALQGRAA